MTSRADQREQRQREIAAVVLQEGSVRITDLAARFGISVMTAHRDLDEMEARGLLYKSRGAATSLPSSLAESSDAFRRSQQQLTKQALAAAALRFVEPGQAVIIDDSTTTFAIAPLLRQRTPLTVITNYLPLVNEIVGVKGITVIGLPGEFHGWANAFLGGLTIDALGNLRADLALLSTSAISDGICYHQARETVDTKQAMMRAAALRVLLVDHTKFERRALHALGPVTQFEHVIVDADTPAEYRQDLRDRGVALTVAERSHIARGRV